MKIIFFFCLLSLKIFGAAADTVTITATGGASIPIAYDSSDSQSLVLSGLDSIRTHLCVINGTSSEIAVSVDGKVTNIPPATDTLLLDGSQSGCLDVIGIGPKVYLRSDSGAPITSGTVKIMVW